MSKNQGLRNLGQLYSNEHQKGMAHWRSNKKHKVGDWCCYGWFLGYWGFGRIEEVSKNTVFIRYGERQMYLPECWKKEWVDVFDTLENAARAYITQEYGSCWDEKLKERMFISFPSECKRQS